MPALGFNEDEIPTYPNDPTLPMNLDGITRGNNRTDRIKWLCPKSKKTKIDGKTTYILSCDNPCTESHCRRVCQIPTHNDLRMNTPFQGTPLYGILYIKSEP